MSSNHHLRWGILGTGNIARQFTQHMGDAGLPITAVGSRQADSARAFAEKFNLDAAAGAYESVLADTNVDAVYLSLPNSLHHEWAIKALRSGKHVLCEKPMATTVRQARQMFDEAGKADRLLMEAFMYRCHPLTHAVAKAVRHGAIGRLRMIRTSFCFRLADTSNIRFNAGLGGGGLMDVGCYCINFSRLIAGAQPVKAQAVGHVHESGVDDCASGSLLFPGGVVASFTCGMSLQADNSAYISGEEGYIRVPIPWKPPVEQARYELCRMTPPKSDPRAKGGPSNETITVDAPAGLFALEAMAFERAARGQEEPTVTREDTLANMRILEDLHQQVVGK